MAWKPRLSNRPFAAILAAAVLPLGVASAQDSAVPHCGAFVSYLEPQSVEVLDLGAEGPSAGDQRLIHETIFDADGNAIGTQDALATLLARTDGQGRDLFFVTLLASFADGELASTALIPSRDTATRAAGPTSQYSRIVTGGTGAFAHATGTVQLETLADGRRQARYDLTCPD